LKLSDIGLLLIDERLSETLGDRLRGDEKLARL
jgi:hypothetical protein